jgi:hypothetical protein
LATHSFIAGISPEAKRLPSFILIFLQHPTWDRANKMRVKKITDLVFPLSG